MTVNILKNLNLIVGLIGVMLIVKLIDIGFAPEHVYPGRVAAFPWAELGVTALAGLIGAALATRSPAVRLWPEEGTARALLLAAGAGLLFGAALAALDGWLRIGDINVGLPIAPLFYLWGAMSQETITHFAPVAIVIGLLSFATPSPRAHMVAFAAVAVAMSALAALGMMSAFQNPDIPLVQTTPAAPMVIGAAVFAIELALFAMMWARGFAASLAMRLGFYAIWHIAWPALVY